MADYVRAIDVDAFIRIQRIAGLPEEFNLAGIVTGMRLMLEDGRVFIMANIPAEIVDAVRTLKEGGQLGHDQRQSIFMLMINHEALRETLTRGLKEVIIDELDERTGLYTAKAVFSEDGVTLQLKMIPSHAVFLALLAGAPIYVRSELVDDYGGEMADIDEDDDIIDL
ncbi:MAG: DUF151 domain-containing protein [Desulfurococcales archaeon]|nr:DUF151 domain-containing protein [Desulfurococcales archaeon]